MGRLHGKRALVTGSSRGIGAAVALRLAADGAAVAVHYQASADRAHEVASKISATGVRSAVVQGDMGNSEEAGKVVRDAATQLDGLDILVNNAALYQFKPIEDIDEGFFATIYNINVRGPLFAIQAALPHLGPGGRIINISSNIVNLSRPTSAVYAGSKAALDAMTKVVAAELGSRGITANCVASGLTDTETVQGMITQEEQEHIAQSSPFKRLGTPRDIADVVAFIASEDSRWITGQVIRATGGERGS